jgi:hypothetical protein
MTSEKYLDKPKISTIRTVVDRDSAMKNQITAKISLKAYIIGDSLPILIVLGLTFIVHPAVGLLILIFPVRYWMLFSSVVNCG